VASPDARNAIEALLAGKPVPVEVTKPHGCSTKWIDKRQQVATDNEKWEKGEVVVELIDSKGIAALRKNDTKKVRFFNVWATWCGPCVEEFPELVATSRKFGLRDFEFISISMDDPKEMPAVKAFLEKHNAIVPDKLKPSLKAEGRKGNAYIFNEAQRGADSGARSRMARPDSAHARRRSRWRVIFRHNGEIDGDELRSKILEHMGRFYVPEPETKP
jgi:thiol-disulfide isomerase/thioredoxin